MEVPKDSPQEKAVSQLTVVEQRLTSRELAAYRFWSKSGQPRLAPSLQEQLYTLFLQGKSVDDILRSNKGLSLAQITTARVEGEWDLRRDEYLSDLLDRSRSNLQQSTLEAVQFMTDILAVAHKKFGTAAKMYIQTGDESHLKGFQIDNIHQYKQIVEILQKLSGAEHQPKKVEERVSGDVTHHHVVDQPIVDAKTVDAATLIRRKLGA